METAYGKLIFGWGDNTALNTNWGIFGQHSSELLDDGKWHFVAATF